MATAIVSHGEEGVASVLVSLREGHVACVPISFNEGGVVSVTISPNYQYLAFLPANLSEGGVASAYQSEVQEAWPLCL